MNSQYLSPSFRNSQLMANLVSFLALTIILPCNFEGNPRNNTILSINISDFVSKGNQSTTVKQKNKSTELQMSSQ